MPKVEARLKVVAVEVAPIVCRESAGDIIDALDLAGQEGMLASCSRFAVQCVGRTGGDLLPLTRKSFAQAVIQPGRRSWQRPATVAARPVCPFCEHKPGQWAGDGGGLVPRYAGLSARRNVLAERAPEPDDSPSSPG